jgi:hypothetical protein
MPKNKIPPRPRNPFVKSVRDPKGIYREKTAKSTAEREDQRDPFSRNAKYKAGVEDFDMSDIEEGFQFGDPVEHKGQKGKVKVPNGPMNMVGITIDGEYALVPEDELKLLTESLARMIELSK